MRRVKWFIATGVMIVAAAAPAAAAEGKRPLALDDLKELRDVYDPEISPDGAWVAYTVRTVDVEADRKDRDVYMTSWDGARTLRMTTSKRSEKMARFSPDGRWLAFLSARGEEDEDDEMSQIWLLDRTGGEAEQISAFPGGVEDYVWSPDGTRLAVIASDPDPEAAERKDKKKTPKPIVIDRYQFKMDEVGYLTGLRQHLYLFDVATRKADILTPGAHDDHLPSWSPDGRSIAFVSKRGPEADRHDNYDIYVIEAKPGAKARQITTHPDADADPSWDSPPAWSPDGTSIAYLQGASQKLIYYGVWKLAVVSAAGGTPRLLAPNLDRMINDPRYSADGKWIYFLLEEDRNVHLARIPPQGGTIERVVAGKRVLYSYDLGPDGRIALLGGTDHMPNEVYAAAAAGEPRPLSRRNEALFANLRLGAVEEISAKSKDGTLVNGFMIRPPDDDGKKRPAILDIHGGPVGQFGHEFDFSWHYFAAQGYTVVAMNPRGSSGRGQEFTKAIYAEWGKKDAQDVLAGVDHAVAKGAADAERLGVGGWSYGGMLTNYVIAQDKRFKAAVSGAGISNALTGYGTDQYIREYENELGTPWRNLDAYMRVSFPFLHADRIVTPTLFMCGEYDFNVPLINSEQMYQALRSLGRDTQLVIYPGEYHGLSKPSYERDRLERNIAWFDKYLKATVPGVPEKIHLGPPEAPTDRPDPARN